MLYGGYLLFIIVSIPWLIIVSLLTILILIVGISLTPVTILLLVVILLMRPRHLAQVVKVTPIRVLVHISSSAITQLDTGCSLSRAQGFICLHTLLTSLATTPVGDARFAQWDEPSVPVGIDLD